MITVKDILSRFVIDNGYDGLYCDEGDPCGCDGSAPCGDGPYQECCMANLGPPGYDADGQHCDALYYPDKRTIGDLYMDKSCQCREIRCDELAQFRKNSNVLK